MDLFKITAELKLDAAMLVLVFHAHAQRSQVTCAVKMEGHTETSACCAVSKRITLYPYKANDRAICHSEQVQFQGDFTPLISQRG